jgi:putative component of toxin-antitoxin plasmid stabilization module
MSKGPWHSVIFEDDNGKEPFMVFRDSLDETKQQALHEAIKNVLEVRGLDLVKTEWLKPLGQGLHEFRIRHDAAEITRMFSDVGAKGTSSYSDEILLRVFVHFYGDKAILLLGGYDKGKNNSAKRQDAEIAKARKFLTQWKVQQAREKAALRKRNAPPKPRRIFDAGKFPTRRPLKNDGGGKSGS